MHHFKEVQYRPLFVLYYCSFGLFNPLLLQNSAISLFLRESTLWKSLSECEWVSTLKAVNTLSTPAERWHPDVLDSRLLLFHDATRCNYSNTFELNPAAPATVKKAFLLGSWRSWDISPTVPPRSLQRQTDRQERVQREKQKEPLRRAQRCSK